MKFYVLACDRKVIHVRGALGDHGDAHREWWIRPRKYMATRRLWRNGGLAGLEVRGALAQPAAHVDFLTS